MENGRDPTVERASDHDRGDDSAEVAPSSSTATPHESGWIDELLLECSTEAIARHDASGRILWVSPNAHVVFGRARSTLLASDLRELLDKQGSAPHRRALERSLDEVRGQGASTCVYRVRVEEGSERWLETVFRGVFEPNGALVEIRSLTRDIDRLKKPLDELALRERQWRGALDAVPVVLLQLDSRLEVVASNKCAVDLFTRPLHELLNRNAIALLCAEDSEEERRLRELTAKLAYVETEIYSAPLERWLSVAFYPVLHPGDGLAAALLRLLDVTSRKRTEEKLHRSLAGLRQLAARLQSVREEERARISREIHDELGHQLTGLSLTLGWLRDRLAPEKPGLVSRVDSMLSILDGTMQAIRRISTELRPGVLDHLGLAPAIRWQCGEFQKRTGVDVELDLESTESSPPPSRPPRASPPALLDPWGRVSAQTSTALFRILQEALTNVARHAEARLVTVSLRSAEGDLFMSVEDDGRGFDVSGQTEVVTCGLFGMEQRALELGGKFWVWSEIDHGTKVMVRVPLLS